MPKVGGHGLDMMYRTCTIQANLDFADEADMVKKMRVGLALQPIATALFANSPFTEGKPNGFLSWRSEIWLDTDADRTGMTALRLRGRLRLRALRRLGARRADVFRQARRPLSRRRRALVPRPARRQARQRTARRAGDAVGLEEPPLDALPRGAAQELPRDARRRRRTLAADLRAAGLLGRPALRPGLARRRLGHRQGLDARGAARRCATAFR